MRLSSTFVPDDAGALARFIKLNPLAQVVSALGDDIEATPLPLVPETDASGAVKALIGHFARANRHVDLLRQSRRAICIFQGPHGYVSLSWMQDRSQAPTWNFETAHLVVDVDLVRDEAETAAAIELLLGAVERDESGRWHSHELGDRYTRLLRGVIGFRAEVVDIRIKFKLGQNERDDVYADIIAGLLRTGNVPLALAMRRHNPTRPYPHQVDI
jgi:transcriptional regulator